MSVKEETVEMNEDEKVDYKTLYEKTQEDLQKVLAKKEELLTETKKAKKEKEEQLAAVQRAEQERAQKDGEFEKLWQTAEQQRKILEEELQKERNHYKQEKIQANAMKLAVELADGNAQSAKLLSKFVHESLAKMADERGSVDDSILAAVKKEFLNNTDFSPLLSGSKAKGGGALGGGNSVAKLNNTMDRESFNKMNPLQQKEFIINKKGTVTDN